MNRPQAHLALLKVTLVVCAVLFAFLFVSILDTRPGYIGSSVANEIVDTVKRVPAAIPGLVKERPKAFAGNSFQVWKTPCLGAHTKLDGLQTQSAWLRMATDYCNPSVEISEAKLENKSNGYVATIFTQVSSKFTSDFIPLVEGPNQFQMELTTEDGENFNYKWTIDRRTATASN